MFNLFGKSKKQRADEAYRFGQQAAQSMMSAVDEFFASRVVRLRDSHIEVLTTHLRKLTADPNATVTQAEVALQELIDEAPHLRATIRDHLSPELRSWAKEMAAFGLPQAFETYFDKKTDDFLADLIADARTHTAGAIALIDPRRGPSSETQDAYADGEKLGAWINEVLDKYFEIKSKDLGDGVMKAFCTLLDKQPEETRCTRAEFVQMQLEIFAENLEQAPPHIHEETKQILPQLYETVAALDRRAMLVRMIDDRIKTMQDGFLDRALEEAFRRAPELRPEPKP